MNIKVYDIQRTDKYRDAEGIYYLLPEKYKYLLEKLVTKEVYSTLLFRHNVLRKVEDYCCKFFDCKEHGVSYELGCYFQKREYQHEGMIKSDIDKFTSLLNVYDRGKFPEEYNLIEQLVEFLNWFMDRWKAYEESCPELFENYQN